MFNESFEKWCINQGYVELAPSPLIRNDNHLFTFSPFEDLEDNYLEEKRFKGFKVQDCFRNVFPQNLVNPLSTPLQKLVSIHDFSFSDSLGELKNCVMKLTSTILFRMTQAWSHYLATIRFLKKKR